MNPHNLDPKEQLAVDVFKDIKPFTITVNDGTDAMFLSMALMRQITGSNKLADEALKLIATHAGIEGAEKAADSFFAQARKANLDFPAFVQPVLVLMFSHIIENKDKIKAMIKKQEDNE